jgi:hypothetical protein
LTHAQFNRSRVSFNAARFVGGEVSFWGAKFSGGEVSFWRAEFRGGTVNFYGAKVSDGMVTFDERGFMAGTSTGRGNRVVSQRMPSACRCRLWRCVAPAEQHDGTYSGLIRG